MSEDSKTVRAAVEKLAAEIDAGRYGTSNLWGGADVVISRRAPKPSSKDSFYPDKRNVTTDFAGELSWLFASLRDVFGATIDFQSKYEFYGRMADAADQYQATNPIESRTAKGLLKAVAAEAALMADQIQ